MNRPANATAQGVQIAKVLAWLIFLLFILICHRSPAQEALLFIKGAVQDSKTKSPLAFASIGIKGKSIGVLTNAEGNFELSVPFEFRDDSLKISYLGYKTFINKVSLMESPVIIYLEESPVVLNEVTIRDTQLTAKEVLERSRSAIPLVSPSKPYLMEAFFRSWEKIDFTDSITYPGTLLEAAAVIYDPGYHTQKRNRKDEKIYVREIRRSQLMPGWNHSHNSISSLLKENDVRYNDLSSFRVLTGFLNFPNNLVHTFEEPTQLDGEDLYVIKIQIPNSLGLTAFYQVYVSMDDHAILQFELSGRKNTIDYSREWHTDHVIHKYIFRRYQNQPYLNYAGIHYTIKKLDTVNKKIMQTEEYYRALLINDVITEDVEKMRKSLGTELSGKSLERQVGTYNESFWKHYNMVLENPLDEKILSLFEEHEKLEAQYMKLNQK